MEIVSAFLVITGVPFFVAVYLDGIDMRRPAKAAMVGSLPAALAIFMYRPLVLATELGLPLIALVAVLAWVLGFATGPLVRAILRGAMRFARPS